MNESVSGSQNKKQGALQPLITRDGIFVVLGMQNIGEQGFDGFLDLALILFEREGKFQGNEPHGLLQQTPFAKGQFLVLADEDQFLEHVGDVTQAAALSFSEYSR